MNNYQTKLYDMLNSLATESEAFFVSNQVLDDKLYRIFLYRIASYSDFLLPGALESRGTMFEIDRAGKPVRLASLPFEKFFNLNENPMTMDLDLTKVKEIYDKEDGSLISTFLHEERVMLKSKGSLQSEQAQDAQEHFDRLLEAGVEEAKRIHNLTKRGYTVIMEWVSPDNRIVLGYDEPMLIVLGVRNNNDGEYLPYSYLEAILPNMIVERAGFDDPEQFINAVEHEENKEGYVVLMENGQRVKVKTAWYLHRHRIKDSISNMKHLVDAILSEATDDIKSLFAHDDVTINYITDVENKVIPQYNHLIKEVENFYEENKELDRKSYAIKAQQLNDGRMGLYMNMYLGKENDYKHFFLKNLNHYVNAKE